jgi:hypothetical protein
MIFSEPMKLGVRRACSSLSTYVFYFSNIVGFAKTLQNEFLMHAILMTGASHLQRLNPHDDIYAAKAAKHLHLSLRSFRNALSAYVPSLGGATTDALMGTAFLLIIQACNTPSFDPDSPVTDGVLPHSQGVFDIIRLAGDAAQDSIFKPLCTPEFLPATSPTTGPALDLVFMINTCVDDNVTGDQNSELYIAIIESLTIVLETITSGSHLGGTPPQPLLTCLVQWLSFLPPEFITLINSNDPKALVIMAYYYAIVAFILSKTRSGWWWMRERPIYMIGRITAFLGEEWMIWLRWPMEVMDNGLMGASNSSMDLNTDNITDNENETDGEGILKEVRCQFNKITISS